MGMWLLTGSNHTKEAQTPCCTLDWIFQDAVSMSACWTRGLMVEERIAPPDRDGLQSLVRTVARDLGDQHVLAVVEAKWRGPNR